MKRFLVIGLDGAEPTLVEPWMDAGYLPHLTALRERGSYGRLASTVPPATFPAWTSCVTGVNPGRHGEFDFTMIERGSYGIRFLNSTHRRAPALWNVLSAARRRVCVIAVPGTYPPEAVNGIMVAGFDSPVCTGIDRSFVNPPERFPEVQDWRFAEFQESHIGPGWHDRALPLLLNKIGDKEAVACRLLKREAWDFAMVVFGESDTVAHHFWLFHDPNSPRHRPGRESAIRQVYERLDAAVGALIEAAGDDVAVAVVSDHGFGGAGTGVVHLNNWLAEQGDLAFAGPSGSALKSLALRFAPERWRGALFRRLRGLAEAAESRSRFSGIDWSRTCAWSEELNYFPSIRINLEGREPHGQVAETSYDTYCVDLCARLEAWAPVRKAWRRADLYQGDYVDRAPDIVLDLELEDGYSHSCLRSRGGPAFRRIAADEHLGGKERGMNGTHRPAGIFFLSEAGAAWAGQIEDIAPTVLAVMGVPGPAMDGTPLVGVGETDERRYDSAPESGYTAEEEKVVEQRLRDLGYFE